MRKSLVLGLVLCILCGCSHKKEKADLPVIALDCNQLSSIHDWGVLDRLEIVRLDSEEALFGDIDRIVRYKDRIYLMDANKTRTVYIYDLSGKYINKISKYGQGPDEYLQLADLYIDPTDASLNVATRIDRKIMKFDLDGKQLRKVIGTPKAFTRLTQFKDRYVGYMGNYIQDCENPYNVWVLSEKMETKQKTFMIPASWNSFDLGSRYPFSSFQSDFYYTKALDYTVYQMDEADGSFFPKYRFDLGDRSWPEDAKDAQPYEELRRSNPVCKYVVGFRGFQETEHYLLAPFILDGQQVMGVYDKKEGKSRVVSLDTYTDEYLISFGEVIGMDATAIYSLVPAWYLKDLWVGRNEYNDFEAKYPEQVKRLREKFDSVDEEGNPFLLIHYLK